MSYPPPSGPPNPGEQPNPFAAPQPGQQPPPAPGPVAGQPQYPAYPQQPGAYPPGYGYPGAAPMTSMPGTVKAARILHFVFGGINLLLSVAMFVIAGVADDPDVVEAVGEELPSGFFITMGVLLLVVAALGIVSASLFGRGKGGVRVLSIVTGVVLCITGVLTMPIGFLTFVAGVLIIVFCSLKSAGAWFGRPRA